MQMPLLTTTYSSVCCTFLRWSSKLPQDVIHCIFAYLTAKEITAASSTCQNYHHSFTRLTPRILRNRGREVSLRLSAPQLTLFLQCPHFRFQLLHLSCLPAEDAARDHQSPVPRQANYFLTPALLSTIAANLPQLETLECAVASVEKNSESSSNNSNSNNSNNIESSAAASPSSSASHLLFPGQLKKLHVKCTSSPAQVSNNLKRVIAGVVASNMPQLADLTLTCAWLKLGGHLAAFLDDDALDGLLALKSQLRRLTFSNLMTWEKAHFLALRQLSSLEYFHTPRLPSIELSWLVAPGSALQQVDVVGFPFTETYAQSLSSLSSLKIFAPETYTCLDSLFLSNFPQLHTASFFCTSRVSTQSLAEALATLPNLHTLTLSHPNINVQEMTELLAGMKALTDFNLGEVLQVESLKFLVPESPYHRTLRRFSLQGFILPTLEELNHLSLLRGLREVRFERCTCASRSGSLLTLQDARSLNGSFRAFSEQLQRLVIH